PGASGSSSSRGFRPTPRRARLASGAAAPRSPVTSEPRLALRRSPDEPSLVEAPTRQSPGLLLGLGCRDPAVKRRSAGGRGGARGAVVAWLAATLLAGVLVPSRAEAADYGYFIDVDDVAELAELLVNQQIDAPTFEVLSDLMNDGIDLATGSREE